MEHSYNGWVASPNARDLNIKPFSVAGINFPPGVRAGDVAIVLGYVALQFHERVEPLVDPGCWGYSFRPNKNDPSELSCHASGTAIDINAPQHPNGIDAVHNFSAKQIAEVHRILAGIPELADVVHWGGDWHEPHLRPDPMHFEIHSNDLAKLRRVAAKIQAVNAVREQEKNMSHVTAAKDLLKAANLSAGKALNELKQVSTKRVKVRAQIAALWTAIRALRAVIKALPDA